MPTLQQNYLKSKDRYRSNMLRIIVVLNLITCAILCVYRIIFPGSDELVYFGFVGTLAIIQGVIWRCLQQRNLQIAGWLAVTPTWLFIAHGSYVSGGIYASVIMAFVFPILLAGILLGTRATIGFLILTLVHVLFLLWIDLAGYLPYAPARDLPFRLFVIFVIFIPMTILFVYHLTNWERAEDENLQLQLEAERANLQLQLEAERMAVYRQLTQDIAHDLRTPLTVMMTKSYLARKKYEKGQDIAPSLEALDGYIGNMRDTLEDFFELALLDHQRYRKPPMGEVTVNSLVQDVLASVENHARQKNITLTLNTSEASRVCGNEQQLRRVVRNLIQNAIQYSYENDFVCVDIVQDSQEVFIRIRDNGIGVAPEHHDKIFERFYRVNAARTKDEYTGSGIGLAIAQKVVKAHHGIINVESDLGVGSTFTIVLPSFEDAKAKSANLFYA